METCSTHRFCTCNTYDSGSYHKQDPNSSPRGYGCRVHHDPKTFQWYENASIESDGASTICYGYTSSIKCEAYHTQCAGDTTGYAYTCTGHRSYDASRVISISDCRIGRIIDNSQIAAIQQGLKDEISERKQHLMYSNQSQISYTESNVAERAEVLASQPNRLKDALERLRDRINSLSDYKYQPLNGYSKVNAGEEAKSQSLNDLLNDFNSMHKDCICHSDCTAYGLWTYSTCTCNVNCRCNYF